MKCELNWCGPVHDSSSRFILEWLENRLHALKASTLQKKRIIHVSIELLQNLHHHSAKPQEKIVFSINPENSSKDWIIQSRNPIKAEAKKPLQERWDELKRLNPEALRAQRLSQISQNERSDHGGGGVGLHEILRKSEGCAELSFSQSNSDVMATFIVNLPLYA